MTTNKFLKYSTFISTQKKKEFFFTKDFKLLLKIVDIWMRKSNNKISLRKEKEVNTFAAVIKGKQAFIKNESIFSKNS